MKKAMLSPWHTICLITVAGVLAACEPAAPPMPKAEPAPAPSAKPADAATDAVHGLGALKTYVGTYPSDSNVSFLEQGVLADRLKTMLGKEYPTLLANLRTVGPLTDDAGRWFITGNRPHEGGTEAAAVVVDAAQNAVRVWMLHEGKVSEFVDPMNASIPWPKDVQTMVDNQKSMSTGKG